MRSIKVSVGEVVCSLGLKKFLITDLWLGPGGGGYSGILVTGMCE